VPGASIIWATRGIDLARIYGGGDADQLPARSELGTDVRQLVESGQVRLMTSFAASAVLEEAGHLFLEGDTVQGADRIGPVDEIICATGQRPDLSITRELRLDLDRWPERQSFRHETLRSELPWRSARSWDARRSVPVPSKWRLGAIIIRGGRFSPRRPWSPSASACCGSDSRLSRWR
jgi:hypothetical protein